MSVWKHAIVRALLVPLVAGSLACGGQTGSSSGGTKRMADTLAFLYAQATEQPGRYEFLNRERAEALQAGLFQARRPDPRDQYALARELLLAGRTRDAIDILERLLATAGVTLSSDLPQNKEFFDLMGIAYLRLGEQENCNLNPNTSVCILSALRHTQEEGARQAIAMYERILRTFPDDRGSQWLLNIAYMATGGYPSRVPKRWRIPNLTAKRDTRFPMFFNVARDVGADINTLAGGLCVEDFNRDGLLDLFTTSWGLADPPRFLVADGQGGYVDRTDSAGVKGLVGGPNCRQADYDNDGDADVLDLPIVVSGWNSEPRDCSSSTRDLPPAAKRDADAGGALRAIPRRVHRGYTDRVDTVGALA